MTRSAVRLTGWGRNCASRSTLLELAGSDIERLAVTVRAAASGGLTVRGLGRAYGDAALNDGGVVVRLRSAAPPRFDRAAGVVDTPAGMSIGELLSTTLPRGQMLPVVPGTRHVTVGGALAADIHGKNHHRHSSLGAWTPDVVLVDGTGKCRRVSADAEPDLFWATVGGVGATGVIVSARIRLLPVETSWVRVTSTRHRRLEDLVGALSRHDPPTYQVAWVDGVHGRGNDRRAILEEGEHACQDEVPAGVTDPLALRWPGAAPAPPLPANPLRGAVPRLLNAAWWHRAGDDVSVVPMHRFFFPLDRVSHWNRAYGPSGFAQYQFVVPLDAAELVARALDSLNDAGVNPTLVVVKTMGPSTAGPLSFPMPGITAAIDVPNIGAPLLRVLGQLDQAVIAAGGRIYLVKDSTTTPEAIAGMYPGLSRWRETCDLADPRRVFSSDLIRRLRLR